MDTLKITILPDGTIKTETDKVSMPNHANAEAFLRETARLAGGTTTVKAKQGHHHHHTGHGAHEHDHAHDHAHDHHHH
jgi:hypothetical protein